MELINEILDKFCADGIYISYLTTLRSQFIVGKGTYTISDLLGSDIVSNRIVELVYANYALPGTTNNAYQNPISFNFTADSVNNNLSF